MICMTLCHSPLCQLLAMRAPLVLRTQCTKVAEVQPTGVPERKYFRPQARCSAGLYLRIGRDEISPAYEAFGVMPSIAPHKSIQTDTPMRSRTSNLPRSAFIIMQP